MKRYICSLLVLMMFVVVLSGCGDSNEKLSDEFCSHLKNYYEVTDSTQYQTMFKTDNIEFFGADIEVEKKDYGTYHIIATMGNIFYPGNQIWNISLDELKREMNVFAEAFIDFAKIKDLDNDYYLYVKIYNSSMVSFVYDYEEDVLYLPQKYDLYCEMYSLFGTTSEYQISESEEGIEWLVQNGFGEVKHHEYESIYDFSFPGVYIDDNGEFKSYNLNWSNAY